MKKITLLAASALLLLGVGLAADREDAGRAVTT